MQKYSDYVEQFTFVTIITFDTAEREDKSVFVLFIFIICF